MNIKKLPIFASTILCSAIMLATPFNSHAAGSALTESGDTVQNAQSVSMYSSYTGNIDHASDVDYYSFVPSLDGNYGCFYNIEMFNESVASYAVFNLYDKNFTPVTSFSAANVGVGINTSKAVGLDAGETYYLSVSSGSKLVSEGAYGFSISTVKDDHASTLSAAKCLELNTTTSGVIQCIDDKDIFCVNPASFRMMSVNVLNTSDVSAHIVCKVLDANGNILSQGACGTGDNFLTEIRNLNSNTDYFIQITGPQGASYKVTPGNVVKKIVYHLNKGTNAKNNPSTYTCGVGATLENPEKNGYEFKGWYTSPAYNKKVTSISSSQTGEVHLYAKWEKRVSGSIVSLKKKKVTNKSVTLSWSKVSKATGYEVYQGNKKIAVTKKRNCKVSNLTAAKKYVFKVRSYREYTSGTAYGKYKKIIVYTSPNAPTINYTQGEDTSWLKGQFSVAWTDQKNVDGYQIYVSHFQKWGYQRKGTVDADTTVFTVNDLLKKGYWVRVRAYIETDEGIVYGAYSKPVKVYAKSQD